ncbi:MAG TPA: hypothetical protein VKS81_07175 [Bacteroidota bacterium]|nr:hypothetical protein [Bacteroidota bacterium]
MKRFLNPDRMFGIFLISSLLLIGVCPAAARYGKNPQVTNVQFETKGDTVTIHYDLVGSPDAVYRIGVVLKKESDQTLRYVPKEISGDIGDAISAGTNKTIIWNLSDEFPRGLDGNDFYFEIGAEDLSPSTSIPWLGIGAAAVAGAGVIWFIVSSKPTNQSASNLSSFPKPPGRP